ncbi:23S rRNA methyltransferase attenuation leader peptide [Escherichia coli]|nr:23S rRNA methyltransferase attenuation leader peptide [Escherichia coli]
MLVFQMRYQMRYVDKTALLQIVGGDKLIIPFC